MAENLTITLLPWEAQMLLESVGELEAKWKHINSTSQDEDVIADTGNDLVKLNMVKKRLREEAVRAFGEWANHWPAGVP